MTITTVGYGDLVPETTTGRMTAVGLMLAGLGLLGAAAASLAAYFRLEGDPEGADSASSEDHMADEIAALRRDVARLVQLAEGDPGRS